MKVEISLKDEGADMEKMDVVTKKWVSPRLITIVKTALEEKTLSSCKYDPFGDGPGQDNLGCNNVTVCSTCAAQNFS